MQNSKTEIKDVDAKEMQEILDNALPDAKKLLDLPDLEGFAVMVVSRSKGLKASIHSPADAAMQIVLMMNQYQINIADVIKKYVERRQ